MERVDRFRKLGGIGLFRLLKSLKREIFGNGNTVQVVVYLWRLFSGTESKIFDI